MKLIKSYELPAEEITVTLNLNDLGQYVVYNGRFEAIYNDLCKASEAFDAILVGN